MDDSYRMPIQIQSDENGFFDRECPNDDCLFNFKVDLHDWEEKIVGNDMHCPRCGHTASFDQWWTQDQLEVIHKDVMSFTLGLVHDELKNTFGELERDARHNKFVRISYQPGSRPVYANLPISQTDAWSTEIKCSDCETKFSVIGNAYFCPCCGKDLTTAAIKDSLSSYRRRINDFGKLYALFENDFSSEEAARQLDSLREATLNSIFGTFESFCKGRYSELRGNNPKRGVFQRLRDGEELFNKLVGFSYESCIGEEGYAFLNIMVNRRHLLTHSNGLVDSQYISKTGDTSYEVGQRIIVKDSDLSKLLDVIESVVNVLLSAESKAE